MARLPYAARTLLRQTGADPQYVTFEDLDGFGVYRTLVFDDSMADLLAPLEVDPRVASVDGPAITFVTTNAADDAANFPIAEVREIISEVVGFAEEMEAVYQAREDELKATPVKKLREDHPDLADLKKNEIVAAIMEREFA